MGYSDQKYFSRPQVDIGVFDLGTSTGAGTASNSLTQTAANMLPAFTRRTQINNIEVEVIVAPNAAATALVLSFLNGTNTFGAVTLTTATASQILSGVMTAANAIFAIGGQPTEGLIGTFTASGGTAGKYRIQFEEQELPS
jgi:hypothetical protein